MPHVTPIKIRGYHLDLYGHVNNARYLEFLEEGRWSWLESRGDPGGFKDWGWGFSVVNVNINYRRAATVGEVLEIRTALKSLGRRSGVMHQEAVLQGTDTLVVDADVTFVLVSFEDGKAVAIEGELRERLGGMLEEPGGAWHGEESTLRT
ncbi:MAG: thioesterase family protein [Deferrisomatales bacterium]|nr:thioesterase family protein [Deferrisomatales bacterium]